MSPGFCTASIASTRAKSSAPRSISPGTFKTLSTRACLLVPTTTLSSAESPALCSTGATPESSACAALSAPPFKTSLRAARLSPPRQRRESSYRLPTSAEALAFVDLGARLADPEARVGTFGCTLAYPDARAGTSRLAFFAAPCPRLTAFRGVVLASASGGSDLIAAEVGLDLVAAPAGCAALRLDLFGAESSCRCWFASSPTFLGYASLTSWPWSTPALPPCASPVSESPRVVRFSPCTNVPHVGFYVTCSIFGTRAEPDAPRVLRRVSVVWHTGVAFSSCLQFVGGAGRLATSDVATASFSC